MMKRRDLFRSVGALLAGLVTGKLFSIGAASAHEYELGKLIVEHPWIRAPKARRDEGLSLRLHSQ